MQVTFYEALNRGRPLPVPPVTQNMHAATRNMLADEDRQLQRSVLDKKNYFSQSNRDFGGNKMVCFGGRLKYFCM